jgi:hypothetical protein
MYKLITFGRCIIIFLLYMIYVHTLPLDGVVPKYNLSNIYANLASDEVYTPDQYAFNVSCLNCFELL